MDNGQQVKKKVLFLCTHNAARSQMAEGLLRGLAGGKFEAFSAGTEPEFVNDFAVKVMQEVGIDISHYRSKPVDLFLQQTFDYVVTLCDMASEKCPVFPGATQSIRWTFPDPAKAVGSDEERLRKFRDTRDAISQKISQELVPLA